MPNAQEQMNPQPLDIIEFTDPEAPTRFTWPILGDLRECTYVTHTSEGYREENAWRFPPCSTDLGPISASMERARFQSHFIVNQVSMGMNHANDLLASFLRSRSPCR